ncbi:hypothetical protein [Amycolatopsis sp.]|uniref:cyanobactin maturation protease PatG family protein n=1 Tax=Amycolatopsis sp. TaxID=37632 RepID=UPI002C5FB415|nr:hypothetical protein [Amycolatopsis sp.]HVV12447.1 hypothetical protein [Amycolatopsis sp.]
MEETATVAPADAGRPPFVYALGKVEPRFPSLAVEKEFAQASGRYSTSGLTDRQVLRTLITDRQNRYLARLLCWVFSVEGVECYIVRPRDPSDFELLADAVRDEPRRDDLDVVIGTLGPIAPPEVCNGLALPTLVFDQIYSFDRDSLVDAIPRPDSVPEDRADGFRRAAGELFDRIMQMADNAGATDEHRALNYLAVRYPAIYSAAAEANERNVSLTGVQVLPSRLSGARKIVEVVFTYTHRQTDVTEKRFVRVDVTEEFMFLAGKLSDYFDR